MCKYLLIRQIVCQQSLLKLINKIILWGEWYYSLLICFNLQSQKLRKNSTLSKTAGYKPEACLACSDEHVAQFVLLAIKTPDRANTVGNVIAEKVSNEIIRLLNTGSEYD